MRQSLSVAGIAAACLASQALAQEVGIAPGILSRSIDLDGQTITIARNQDQNARITGEFAKTSRPCPPFCITEMEAAPGVETVGEREVIAFIEGPVADGDGLLVDSRIPEWFARGTIPGAVNVPFTTLAPNNPYRDDILRALGAVERNGRFDFAAAKALLLFCNGPWCDQSPLAIRNLISAGYPSDKLKYYRGGMQLWQLLGLTVANPQTPG